MREIKFRMWSSIANKYFGIKETILCLNQQITLNEGKPYFGVPWNHVKDGMVFEQYTGIKDKNGKEIYEGDIVNELPYNRNDIVEYISCGYSPFEYSGGGETDNEECIVVGNIHENPELIA